MAKVRIFSTPTCPWCEKAKEFFKNNNIEFENLDVSQDEKSRDEMFALSKQMGVPVIDIDGTILIGFNQPRLKELLHLS